MAKDPAFLFYPGDWLGGTLGMTFEQKGAYMELLMLQFNRGHMTEHMIGQVIGQHWVTLKDKFKQDTNGLWYNIRLEEEKEKRKNFVSTRKNNLSGKNQYTSKRKKSGHTTKHTASRMENANEDEIVIKKIIKSKLDIFEELFSDEIFISDLSRTHRGKDLKQAFEECYIHHSNAPNPPVELWQWKQKFNTWLTITPNGKRNNKTGGDRSISDLINSGYGNPKGTKG